MNSISIIILAIVALLFVVALVFSIRLSRRRKKCEASGCSSCSFKSFCASRKQ